MKKIILPNNCNYVGAFLTLRCNMNCPYCINKMGEFKYPKEMSGEDWIKGLSRIETRSDLPITLSGGEPTVHNDFYNIASSLWVEGQPMDLLTNGEFNMTVFKQKISPKVFKRVSPYASIRFSYHTSMTAIRLVAKVVALQDLGYHVGIWGLDINKEENRNMAEVCAALKIDFRVKEYLDETHGSYKYPEHLAGKVKKCLCKPSELLIGPDGYIYRCHRDLYAQKGAYAHILDEEVLFPTDFMPCENPRCSPCDVKIKNNRFQQWGHCSVEIQPC